MFDTLMLFPSWLDCFKRQSADDTTMIHLLVGFLKTHGFPVDFGSILKPSADGLGNSFHGEPL